MITKINEFKVHFFNESYNMMSGIIPPIDTWQTIMPDVPESNGEHLLAFEIDGKRFAIRSKDWSLFNKSVGKRVNFKYFATSKLPIIELPKIQENVSYSDREDVAAIICKKYNVRDKRTVWTELTTKLDDDYETKIRTVADTTGASPDDIRVIFKEYGLVRENAFPA
jgi:hypothetical protein